MFNHTMFNRIFMLSLLHMADAMAQPILPLPPMGFNNWARYETNISEAIFVDAADSMIKHGLLSAGYNRINLDDAWSTKERASNGSMVWDDTKFPRGLYWLTAHLKSNGFIPGIYTDAGNLSCGGYPGALDHEQMDYDDFAKWGFEYLKIDGCNMPDPSTDEVYHEVYSRWHRLLSSVENPMVFSDSAPAYFADKDNLTDWYTVMGWAQKYGQLARHSDDIQTYPDGASWDSMMNNYNYHVRLARYQKPGYFNDPEFLNVDHPSYSLDEKKSHFALWCAFSAPLILSTDLTAITAEEVEYLTNKDLIAINQDRLIQQATLVGRDKTWDVLSKSLENGDRVLVALNKGDSVADTTISWTRIGFSPSALRHVKSLSVKDLWTSETIDVSSSESGIAANSVASHGTAVFCIANSAGDVTPTGLIFNTRSMKCLTDISSGSVVFATCDGSDTQTWGIRPDGHISSVLRPEDCIVDKEGVVLSSRSGCHSDSWSYDVSGNVVNGNSNNCLTQAANGAATVVVCGYELNEQVHGLPVGVTVGN